MKVIYAILFFAGVLLLVILAFLLMRSLDNGGNRFRFTLIIISIIGCIALLGYFISRYMKLPHNEK